MPDSFAYQGYVTIINRRSLAIQADNNVDFKGSFFYTNFLNIRLSIRIKIKFVHLYNQLIIMAIRSVLTADIVNSTRLKGEKEKKLLATLKQVLSEYRFEFYRGDSFQVFIQDPKHSLRTALLCRCFAISLSKDKKDTAADIRISIGIGHALKPAKSLGTAKGEAFILSGRAFDLISKTGTRLSITTTNPLANAGLEALTAYINALLKTMTGKQAEVIFELLKGQTQQVVAKKLRKSKSTIHQHVNAGHWEEIEKLLYQFENIINLI